MVQRSTKYSWFFQRSENDAKNGYPSNENAHEIRAASRELIMAVYAYADERS